ncbi:MAG: phage terminase small subunit P27 family [Terriglobales bacterium]
MGRPRKSPEEHALNGTRPKYDSAAGESTFKGGKPKMPKDLSPAAEAEWKRLVKELTRRGTLTRVDSSALEIYVVTFARWKAVCKEAEERPVVETTWTDQHGTVHAKVTENPASKIAGRLENSMRAMLQQFSATPASREKTKPTKQEPTKNQPVEGSVEWLMRELKRQQAAEAAAGEQEPEPATPLETESETASLVDFDENVQI